nr:uncharacterized protein LOC126053531 [Helicoverpa armigera]
MVRTRNKLSEEEKKKKRREQKKLSMRRAREKMKKDPVALEEKRKKDREYYYRKKSQGEIKTINDLSERQQRQLRNKWRKDAKLRRDRLKLLRETARFTDETPPTSSANSLTSKSTSRAAAGRAVAAKNKRRLKLENLMLKSKLKIVENKLSKYKMRLSRLQNKKKNKERKNKTKVVKEDLSDAVQRFLLSDESSRTTAGKKETITRFKQKKQIRFLNDSLFNLHKKFVTQMNLHTSYKTFCRYRPFWVLNPKVTARETCLCATHTNMELIIKSLKNARMINENSAMAVCKSICCEDMKENCLERKCLICRHKKITFNQFTPTDTIKYERWVTKKVMQTIKGHEKLCQKTIKETVNTSKRQLMNHLLDNIERFMKHTCNMLHQFRVIKNIKINMSACEGLLHIDFSENYNCKYSSEIQSAHFGGSKDQISLHTGVFYYADENTEEKRIVTKSFCTVSEYLNHSPIYICAHLKPIIAMIKTLVPNLKRLHVLSDGPSTQYKNKTMFHLIAAYLGEETQANNIMWHFSESGHGKGAPDGVGGCLKRTADKHVAKGNDVSNIDEFIECVHESCKGIEVIKIDDTTAKEIEVKIKNCTIRPFRGTMQVHQVTWDKIDPKMLQFRRLSCITCNPGASCSHYDLGCISLDLPPQNLHIEIPALASSRSTPVQSCPSPLSNLHSPLMSPNWTPIVQQLCLSIDGKKNCSSIVDETESNDPEKSTSSKILRGLKSRKRIRFADVYSDSSCSPPVSRPETPAEVHQKRSQRFWSSSEEDDIFF